MGFLPQKTLEGKGKGCKMKQKYPDLKFCDKERHEWMSIYQLGYVVNGIKLISKGLNISHEELTERLSEYLHEQEFEWIIKEINDKYS